MGKGTTFIGQPVLNQVVNLMSKDKINILADEKGTDRYTKHLDSYTHLVIMLYAVLTNSSSLREVVLGFECGTIREGKPQDKLCHEMVGMEEALQIEEDTSIQTFHRANQEEEDPSQAGLLFVSSTSATILRPRGVEVVGKG